MPFPLIGCSPHQGAKISTTLGRVIRELKRKLPSPPAAIKDLLERSQRIHQQKRQDSPKVYSVHAPEVECIAKGKSHKRYEFGCKVVMVSTNKSNWIVGIDAVHGNPYDGATLIPALSQVEQLSEIHPKQVFVDKGFRGQVYHPDDVEVCVAGTRKFKGTQKKLIKRRSAIEPVIGHAKQDHCLKRNYLKGQQGDRINALLAGCGFNLRKLFRFFFSSEAPA
ncbi:transposase [Lusitaniella coriacea LEGE 07157]|uniref:Transposase n=1 Tax=Lusitaniella coriacea LEGE 07157 TaxID=945747 RepID=A0A8J7AR35_9CYAN|nr:transposase [Lusitaniella coriacea]MBE9114401.1 transposase [Lusitaniella coriacea LEGE 07157]